jgi:hypothetical protein
LVDPLATETHHDESFLIASYDVINHDSYVIAIKSHEILCKIDIDKGRYFLWINNTGRRVMADMVKNLLKNGHVTKVSVFYDNLTRVDIYNMANLDNIFAQNQLGITMKQISEEREKNTLTGIRRARQYDNILFSVNAKPLHEIIADFLGYKVGTVDSIIEGHKRPSEYRLKTFLIDLHNANDFLSQTLVLINKVTFAIDNPNFDWRELHYALTPWSY